MGNFYSTSDGLVKDDEKALSLFEAAAKQGNIEACNYMSLRYAFGYGVPKDSTRANEFYRVVAESDVQSMELLSQRADGTIE
jgi:TPR repeat protein